MRILAIDPGPERSAIVDYNAAAGHIAGQTWSNDEMLEYLGRLAAGDVGAIVIEMIASYGMAVGHHVFETCVWIGRFMEAGGHAAAAQRMFRRDVKLHLCGQSKAKDTNVRQALIDRFGPGKPKAIGTKKAPGPLYGIKGDEWQALAVAVTYADQLADEIADSKISPFRRKER